MNVLVVGGSGFLGHNMWLYKQRGKYFGCDLPAYDITDEFTYRLMLPQNMDFVPDVVYNLACFASPSEYQKKSFETLRACSTGVALLAEKCLDWGARLIQASTSEVYGDPLEHPQKESYWGNVNPRGPRSCYDEGKRFAEALLYEFHEKKGLDVVTARIFNTYGPHYRKEDTRFIPELFKAAKAKRPFNMMGDPFSSRSYCYVTDMVRGLHLLADKGKSGEVYNIGNPDERKAIDVIKTVAGVTKRPFKLKKLPPRRDDPVQRKPDISKIMKLGWKPKVDFETGLKQTWNWAKRQ